MNSVWYAFKALPSSIGLDSEQQRVSLKLFLLSSANNPRSRREGTGAGPIAIGAKPSNSRPPDARSFTEHSKVPDVEASESPRCLGEQTLFPVDSAMPTFGLIVAFPRETSSHLVDAR
jgi:hypothetical protein